MIDYIQFRNVLKNYIANDIDENTIELLIDKSYNRAESLIFDVIREATKDYNKSSRDI